MPVNSDTDMTPSRYVIVAGGFQKFIILSKICYVHFGTVDDCSFICRWDCATESVW